MPNLRTQNDRGKMAKKMARREYFCGERRFEKTETISTRDLSISIRRGLHVGHPKGFTAEDIHARYYRMHGKEVLYPIGWDAFGLPTENYAIKIGKNPKEVTEESIANFGARSGCSGFSDDWGREVNIPFTGLLSMDAVALSSSSIKKDWRIRRSQK